MAFSLSDFSTSSDARTNTFSAFSANLSNFTSSGRLLQEIRIDLLSRSRDRRASCLSLGLPFGRVFPNPDGSLAALGDRQQSAYLYRLASDAGGTVCGTAALVPRVAGAASLAPRVGQAVAGSAALVPRVNGTAGFVEC